MPRWWVRLVAVVTLVVYLTSSGVMMAYAYGPFSQRTCNCDTTSPSAEESSTQVPDSGCKHCRAKQGGEQAQPSDAPDAKNQQAPSSDEPCPCQDDHPRCPTCPVPGGCMYCNPAKVPCHFPPIALLISTELCCDCLILAPPVLLSFFPGSLFRPPRA